jgi:hypothetical protein
MFGQVLQRIVNPCDKSITAGLRELLKWLLGLFLSLRDGVRDSFALFYFISHPVKQMIMNSRHRNKDPVGKLRK